VFYGVNGDRDAMPDVGVLGALIEESLAELVEASPVATERRTAVAALGRVRRSKPGSRRPVARAPRRAQS